MHRLCGQAGVERRQLLVGGAHAARQRRNRRGLRIPQVHVADLVQRDVLQTAAQIQSHGLRQRRQDVAAQERTVAGQRIGDLHAHALDLVRVVRERAVILVAHERIGQGLHQTVFRQLVGHLALAALIVGQADLALHGGRGHGHRNLVISDQSGDLLDQVARLVQIGAPARRHDRELAVAAAGHTAADIGQDLADPVHIGVQSRHARDLGGLEMNRATTRHIVHVGRMFGSLAVAVADQQLGGHLRGGGLQLRVHAAFETAGGLGRGLVAAGGARDRHLVEVRGLQQDVLGLGRHLAVQAAHHAGQTDDARSALTVRGVGDQQVLHAQLVVLAVQGDQMLAFAGAAHHDRAFELVHIIGVHRLAQIEHDVVGHVHGQRDRTHAGADQAAAHPVRRLGGRVEAADGAGVVAVAAGHAVNRVVVLDRHLDVRGGAGFQTLGERGLPVQRTHRIDVGGAGGMVVFAGHAAVRERIAAIRRDVDLQQRLVQMQQVHRVVAGLQGLVFGGGEAVLAQQDDAVMAVAQAQLAFGGAHAVGDVAVGLARFDAEVTGQHGTRQRDDDLLPGLHVRGAAHDAAGHLVAVLVDLVVFLADVHMAPVDGLAVLLRLGRGVHHVADHDRAGDLGGVDLLLLQADLDQVPGQLLVRQILGDLDMVLEPININHRHGLLTLPSRIAC